MLHHTVRSCGAGCFAVVELQFSAPGKAVLRYILGSMWTAEEYFKKQNENWVRKNWKTFVNDLIYQRVALNYCSVKS